MHAHLKEILLALCCAALSAAFARSASAQANSVQVVSAQPAAPPLPKGVSRLDGTDADSGIAYALITLEGRPALAAPLPAVSLPQNSGAEPPPRLTAQCTRTGDKWKYELLVDVGGGPALVFVAPWRAGHGALFMPPVQQVMGTMEFLGYVKVKPVKRQFDLLEGPMTGEMRYATPGSRTSNLEPIAFYMQYLKALPKLRLNVPGRGVVEFETLAWQAVVRAEPLCRMSGL